MKAKVDPKTGKTTFEVQFAARHGDKWIQMFALLAHGKVEEALTNAEKMYKKTQ